MLTLSDPLPGKNNNNNNHSSVAEVFEKIENLFGDEALSLVDDLDGVVDLRDFVSAFENGAVRTLAKDRSVDLVLGRKGGLGRGGGRKGTAAGTAIFANVDRGRTS